MDRAPEVRVELEVGDTPLAAHGSEHAFEMRLHLGVRAVEHVPRAAPPAAKCHLVGTQRRSVGVLDEPSRMLLEDMRLFFGDEGRNPDRRLEATRLDRLQHLANISAERRARFQPVAHRRLIPLVDLHVGQSRNLLRDDVEIVEDVLRGDTRTEAVP